MHDRRLALLAHDVLDRVSLVVLLATGLKEVGAALERVKDLHISIPCTDKQHIFTQVVLQNDGLVPISCKHFHDLHVLALCCQEEGRSTFVVGPETNLWLFLIESLSCLYVVEVAGYM